MEKKREQGEKFKRLYTRLIDKIGVLKIEGRGK